MASSFTRPVSTVLSESATSGRRPTATSTGSPKRACAGGRSAAQPHRTLAVTYNALSSFGGNRCSLAPALVRDGVLAPSSSTPSAGCQSLRRLRGPRTGKLGLLHRAFSASRAAPHGMTPALATFRHEHRDWLEPRAVLAAPGGVAWHHGRPTWRCGATHSSWVPSTAEMWVPRLLPVPLQWQWRELRSMPGPRRFASR